MLHKYFGVEADDTLCPQGLLDPGEFRLHHEHRPAVGEQVGCRRAQGVEHQAAVGPGIPRQRRTGTDGNGVGVVVGAVWHVRRVAHDEVEWLELHCARPRSQVHVHVQAHRRRNGAANTTAAILEWARSAPPIPVDYAVIFKGLPEQMILQILVGIQYRSDNGTRTFLTVVRAVVEAAREADAQSIFELDIAPRGRKNHVLLAMIASIRTGVHLSLATPESEYTNDQWDLTVFGARGTISFTALHQLWLRGAAKHWVVEDLPLHRGRKAGHGHRSVVGCLNRLSESLRLTRDDNGDDPASLGRRDIVNFLNRLAHLQSTGQISMHTHLGACTPADLTGPSIVAREVK